MRFAFAGVSHEDTALVLGLNAARAYKFDIENLTRVAADIGPRSVTSMSPSSRRNFLPTPPPWP